MDTVHLQPAQRVQLALALAQRWLSRDMFARWGSHVLPAWHRRTSRRRLAFGLDSSRANHGALAIADRPVGSFHCLFFPLTRSARFSSLSPALFGSLPSSPALALRFARPSWISRIKSSSFSSLTWPSACSSSSAVRIFLSRLSFPSLISTGYATHSLALIADAFHMVRRHPAPSACIAFTG